MFNVSTLLLQPGWRTQADDATDRAIGQILSWFR